MAFHHFCCRLPTQISAAAAPAAPMTVEQHYLAEAARMQRDIQVRADGCSMLQHAQQMIAVRLGTWCMQMCNPQGLSPCCLTLHCYLVPAMQDAAEAMVAEIRGEWQQRRQQLLALAS